MSCYYCNQENLNIPDTGTCEVCKRNVCTNPSSRKDKHFHGEDCECCHKAIICELHIYEHSKSRHDGDPSSCFPKLICPAGIDAFGGASSASFQIGPPIDSANESIARFLRLMNPIIPSFNVRAHEVTADDWIKSSKNDAQFPADIIAEYAYLSLQAIGSSWARIFYSNQQLTRLIPRNHLNFLQSISKSVESSLNQRVFPTRPLSATALASFAAVIARKMDNVPIAFIDDAQRLSKSIGELIKFKSHFNMTYRRASRMRKRDKGESDAELGL